MEEPRSARITILLIFYLHGFLFGNWVSRIPEIKTSLGLSEFDLGVLLLAISIGLIVSIFFTGGAISRFGSRNVTLFAAFEGSVLLFLVSLSSTFATLWIILFFFGSSMTFMDVAMNAQAIEVERMYKRSIMSSFHAAYSIAGFSGAALGGFLIQNSFSIVSHFLIVALVVIIGCFSQVSFFLADPKATTEDKTPVFTLPPLALLPIGLIGLLSSIGEGAMGDWTGVFLNEEIGIDIARSTWGFAAFSIMMTIGRLIGDRMTELFSRKRILQLSGIISSVGLLFSVISPEFYVILLGFGLVGLGLSVVIPIVFSIAGNKEGFESGVGIASVASIGYLGFLVGPPFVGFIAELTSLAGVFGLMAGMMLFITVLATTSLE